MSLDQSRPSVPLRLWPGVAGALLVVLGMALVFTIPDAVIYGLFGALAAALAIVLWWLFFSRAPWLDRLGAVAMMIAAVPATSWLLDPSIAGAGQGKLFYFFDLLLMSVALVAWAAASRGLSAGGRRASLAGALLIACGSLALVRTAGVSSSAFMNLHWRWTPTPEQQLMAREAVAVPPPPTTMATAEAPAAPAPSKAPGKPAVKAAERPAPVPTPTASRAAWTGFRGPGRDSVVHEARIQTDWTASRPVELWRRPIGPGWSSFAVDGDLLYTQEQRGEEEVVACYRVSTGEPVWRHRDPARFFESNGGPGPRGTPTLANGRVYTFGATGIVNVLEAATGTLVWSKNAASDTKTDAPYWGFASSPLVFEDTVVLAVSGKLVAYDAASGAQRWLAPSRGGSYSSPHLARIGGVPQILLIRGQGVHGVNPSDGALLWEHAWPGVGAILQPALTPDGDVLISTNDMSGGVGTRRLHVTRDSGAWTATERWTSTGFKPYFSDYVVHQGHAYGFDGRILACLDLADGKRKWKGGRYGHGQMVLLSDQDLLLVLSEDGELALVKAAPDQFTEVARLKAIEGKTWNHPVLAGDVLLVRNGEEMAAFRVARVTAAAE